MKEIQWGGVAKIVGFLVGVVLLSTIIHWIFAEPEIRFFYIDGGYPTYAVKAYTRYSNDKTFLITLDGKEAIDVYKDLNTDLERARKGVR